MDDLRTRLDALEHHTTTLTRHTRRVTRQLRWWRGLAGGLLALALLTWMLPVSTAQEDLHGDWRGLPERVAALEETLRHLTSETDAEGRAELVITGANLRIVNGLGRTDCGGPGEEPVPDCPNGLGNLIVGYNELRGGEEDVRTGSHNVVVGQGHNFSRFGGIVAGLSNTISGDFAVVSGGEDNTASGFAASVSGGGANTASGDFAWVSGGLLNNASGDRSSVSGGDDNRASGSAATVSGGLGNTASELVSTVSGGHGNTASGLAATVSGGEGNLASGFKSSVSGGLGNTASGSYSSVSGGRNRTAAGEADWVAGSLFEDE